MDKNTFKKQHEMLLQLTTIQFLSLWVVLGVKNGNGILHIVVAYSTISLSYYTGLWYGRLGKVYLKICSFILFFPWKNGHFFTIQWISNSSLIQIQVYTGLIDFISLFVSPQADPDCNICTYFCVSRPAPVTTYSHVYVSLFFLIEELGGGIWQEEQRACHPSWNWS